MPSAARAGPSVVRDVLESPDPRHLSGVCRIYADGDHNEVGSRAELQVAQGVNGPARNEGTHLRAPEIIEYENRRLPSEVFPQGARHAVGPGESGFERKAFADALLKSHGDWHGRSSCDARQRQSYEERPHHFPPPFDSSATRSMARSRGILTLPVRRSSQA